MIITQIFAFIFSFSYCSCFHPSSPLCLQLNSTVSPWPSMETFFYCKATSLSFRLPLLHLLASSEIWVYSKNTTSPWGLLKMKRLLSHSSPTTGPGVGRDQHSCASMMALPHSYIPFPSSSLKHMDVIRPSTSPPSGCQLMALMSSSAQCSLSFLLMTSVWTTL